MKYHAYCSMRHNCPLINTGKKSDQTYWVTVLQQKSSSLLVFLTFWSSTNRRSRSNLVSCNYNRSKLMSHMQFMEKLKKWKPRIQFAVFGKSRCVKKTNLLINCLQNSNIQLFLQ